MNFFEPIYYDGNLDFNKAIVDQLFQKICGCHIAEIY